MKNIARMLSPVLACWAWVAWAADTAPIPPLLEFVAAERDRVYSEVPPEVLAFYYTWYGRPERQGEWRQWGGEDTAAHQIPKSTHYPARGAYDSQDPAVVDAHIAQAKACAITGFVATWWGQGSYTDQTLALLLDRADLASFKVSVYWETAPGRGQDQIDRAVDELAYIVSHYGSRPSFLRVDGKPVIFMYGRVRGDVPFEAWPAILTRARAQAGDFLLIADGYTDPNARLFDGVHTYNICVQVQGKTPDEIRAWSADHYASVVNLARRYGKISCVTVIPGYDDTKIRNPGIDAERLDGQTYRVLWEEALRANPDWVLITSWNEWHEGSEIEPSWEDGEQYLKLTGEYAPRLTAGPARPALPPPEPPLNDDQMRVLQALFNGHPIGVLPGFGDAAFWLLDVGLTVSELSWADVADPAVFNPTNIPLVLHAGDETYARTGKSPDDVVPALQRYLAEGGFLVSLPHQPFPFYRDQATGAAHPATRDVGLPVKYGWERPPPGAALAFQFDTESLPGLPATAAFPAGGDLRWRPAAADQVGPADQYRPLARLIDADGNPYGDGIAYVEYQSEPLRSGRTLYAWMGMIYVVDRDELLFALFRFAGERLVRPVAVAAEAADP